MTSEPRSVAIGDVIVGPAWRDPRGLLPRSLDTAFELMAARNGCSTRFRLGGGHQESMYNPANTPESVKPYLTSDTFINDVFFAPVPAQMIIFDRRMVVLEGPVLGGERTAMAVTDPDVMTAAWCCWNSLRPLAVSVHDAFGHDPLARFSPRQREIVHLLADDRTDQMIAMRLDLSLRTVQYEVAAIMRILNVRSRFGAGMAIGRLGLPR